MELTKEEIREQILEGIIEIMEHCKSKCPCYECPIEEFCDAWDENRY